jgi:hypothetical protein
MNHESPATGTARALIVGRSPSVLVSAAQLLREKGYRADATNQFDRVLDDYDVAGLDILIFGGMVPPDTKQRLREEITGRNDQVVFVQGLAGIPGVVAAQVEEAASAGTPPIGDVAYDQATRVFTITLDDAEHVSVEALWATSFTPPEPTSTAAPVFDGELTAGTHVIALPDQVPDVASFAVVRVRDHVRVLTTGSMPQAVTRMAPKSAEDHRLPGVASVVTQHQD